MSASLRHSWRKTGLAANECEGVRLRRRRGRTGGLTAAIYLARYRRRVAVFDAGNSRAGLIPKTHNYPGFVQGMLPGKFDLLRQEVGRILSRLRL